MKSTKSIKDFCKFCWNFSKLFLNFQKALPTLWQAKNSSITFSFFHTSHTPIQAFKINFRNWCQQFSNLPPQSDPTSCECVLSDDRKCFADMRKKFLHHRTNVGVCARPQGLYVTFLNLLSLFSIITKEWNRPKSQECP